MAELVGAAPHNEDLKAVVVVHVNMEGRNDLVAVVVLDMGQHFLQVVMVVVVDKGDRANNLPGALFGVMFHEAVAYEFGDCLGAIRLAPGFRHGIELSEQPSRHGGAETGKRLPGGMAMRVMRVHTVMVGSREMGSRGSLTNPCSRTDR